MLQWQQEAPTRSKPAWLPRRCDGRRPRAMDRDNRSVDCTPRHFLAAWGRGDAGLVPCGACTACCYYPGVVVDEKRDRKRLAHLLTERSPDGGPTDRTHVSLASWSTGKPVRVKSQVRTGLLAGGKEIRIVGPAVRGLKNLCCPDVRPRVRTAPSSAASYKPDRP